NVIFIAHEKESKGADGETPVKRPEVGGSSANDLMKEVDLVGYLQMVGRQRTICFNPTEWFYAKNTCNLEPEIRIPVLVDAKGRAGAANDFLSGIIARYGESQAERRDLTARYEKMMDAIDTAARAATTAEDLNAVKESMMKAEPVFNSRIAGADRLARRAQEIGAVYDKINECYVQA
ncbi:MAG: ATP-binding protein, partial [Prevotellaceae bacterium]|nr:ATP-binding protein [Prevotellaceae bacterium]